MLGGPKNSPRHESTQSVARPSRPPFPVIVRTGAEGARPVRITSGQRVLGAGSEADILVAGSTVSRRHALLELVPEGIRVRDLDSRNGTFYLGQRVTELVVSPGACIRLGTVEVHLDADTAVGSEAGPENYGRLSSRSAAMRALFALLERLEGSLVNVLVEGESGTGKELIARAIHERSSVATGPFVAVNCGALDRDLVKSELFGHRKGSFTGATETRIGAFEAASGGTLFLDEVGELPTDVQPALLRVLEERAVTRLGENEERPVRVRIVAATHRDLEERVREGEFRQDLFYRLMVVRLTVPSLRERPEDVPFLASVFASRAGAPELPESVVLELTQHDWPGNVRELRHAVESYLAIGVLSMATGSSASELDRALAAHADISRPFQELKEDLVDAFMRVYLTRLLAHAGGNVSEAARVSGMERSYLSKLTRRHGIK